jgi:hypothetical protein
MSYEFGAGGKGDFAAGVLGDFVHLDAGKFVGDEEEPVVGCGDHLCETFLDLGLDAFEIEAVLFWAMVD